MEVENPAGGDILRSICANESFRPLHSTVVPPKSTFRILPLKREVRDCSARASTTTAMPVNLRTTNPRRIQERILGSLVNRDCRDI